MMMSGSPATCTFGDDDTGVALPRCTQRTKALRLMIEAVIETSKDHFERAVVHVDGGAGHLQRSTTAVIDFDADAAD